MSWGAQRMWDSTAWAPGGENSRHPVRGAGSRDAVEVGQLPAQDIAVQEEKGAERLVLGGGARPVAGGEIGENALTSSQPRLAGSRPSKAPTKRRIQLT